MTAAINLLFISLSQISFADFLVGKNFRGYSLCQQPPGIKHDSVVAKLFNQVHIMFNHYQGFAFLFEFVQDIHDILNRLGKQSGKRFVKK